MSRDLIVPQPTIRPRWLRVVETETKAPITEPTVSRSSRVEPEVEVTRRPRPTPTLESRRDATRRALNDTTAQQQRLKAEQELTSQNSSDGRQDGQTGTANSATPESVWSTAEKRFAAWDTNGDGFLSRSELEARTTDPTVKGLDAGVLLSLLDHLDDIQQLSNDEYGFENDGITTKDLGALRQLGAKAELNQKVVGTAGWGVEQQQRPTQLFDGDGPNYEAVKQGGIGSCEFLSAAVALAKRDPAAVKQMITENGDGSYTVKFPGAKDPIRVEGLTDVELARSASAGQDGRWIGILEKAYGQYLQGPGKLKADSPQQATTGVSGKTAMEVLTGNGGQVDRLGILGVNLATSRKKLTQALAENRLVTAGIPKDLIFEGTDGLPANHQYTVLGYDPKTDRITLRNPWGGGELVDDKGKAKDGTDDGVFTMSMTEFYQRFGDLTYEVQKKKK